MVKWSVKELVEYLIHDDVYYIRYLGNVFIIT